eukprot:1857578-Rhodomonas_salina.2
MHALVQRHWDTKRAHSEGRGLLAAVAAILESDDRDAVGRRRVTRPTVVVDNWDFGKRHQTHVRVLKIPPFKLSEHTGFDIGTERDGRQRRAARYPVFRSLQYHMVASEYSAQRYIGGAMRPCCRPWFTT